MSQRNLSAKNFKHLIAFIQNNVSSEIEKENWQEVIRTFAEIKPLYDNQFEYIENMNFGHLTTESIFIFKMRFESTIASKMRILYNNRQFEIKRIINICEQNRYLQIIALEI